MKDEHCKKKMNEKIKKMIEQNEEGGRRKRKQETRQTEG